MEIRLRSLSEALLLPSLTSSTARSAAVICVVDVVISSTVKHVDDVEEQCTFSGCYYLAHG